MWSVINFLLATASLACALPVLVLLVEHLASLAAPRPATDIPTLRTSRVAILIPAHNEAAGIAHTVRALHPQLQADDQILVVADNCTDATASLAREAGAHVIERHDTERRGKGFALAAGVDYLRDSERLPNIVLIIDADCQLSAHGIDVLAARVERSARPVQSAYHMTVSPRASVAARISAFAFLVKCHVRSLGRERLGWPCHLMGTGMAFPWQQLQKLPLATSNIVEDMAMGLDLTLAGLAPVFEPGALVTSAAAESPSALRGQRKRWEHGHLQTIGWFVPRLLLHGIRNLRVASIAMALDLAVPPLALLSITWLVLLVATLGLFLLHGNLLALWICISAGSILTSAVLLAWNRFGRDLLPLSSLLLVPWYVLRKLPIYAGFFIGRRSGWMRTARAGETQ